MPAISLAANNRRFGLRLRKTKINWGMIGRFIFDVILVVLFIYFFLQDPNADPTEAEASVASWFTSTSGNSNEADLNPLLRGDVFTPEPTPAPIPPTPQPTTPPTIPPTMKHAAERALAPGAEGGECRYEGHCGIGMTCVADSNSDMGGYCRAYTGGELKEPDHLQQHDYCYSICMREVEAEEYYKFQSKMKVKRVGKSEFGCIVEYERLNENDQPGFTRRQYLEETKNRRIIRVDSVLNPPNTFTALCSEGCKRECRKGFVCHEKVCVRDDNYWLPTKKEQYDMVIITAASSSMFPSLNNLAASARKWAGEYRMVVYNLGLEPSQMQKIKDWRNTVDIRWLEGFPPRQEFSYLPSQVPPLPLHLPAVNNRAWRPMVIYDAINEYKNIFYIDCGATITGPIDPAVRIARRTGAFYVKSPEKDLMEKSAMVADYFGKDKAAFAGKQHFLPSVQAHIMPSKFYDTVIVPNVECALDPRCITPDGASAENHRYDDSSLSVLASNTEYHLPGHSEYLAMSRDSLEANLNEPNFMFLWDSKGKTTHFSDSGY